MDTYKIGLRGQPGNQIDQQIPVAGADRAGPDELTFTEIPIGDLPLYSYDYDADCPPVARALKHAITASDGILVVSPDYNRSIPGALKNAIDWGSRPWGENAFARKLTGIIGPRPGASAPL